MPDTGTVVLVIAILCVIAASAAAVVSGIRGAGMKWYDRTIRVGGGGFILLVFLFAVLVSWLLHS
jgi:hypothetical protein